MVIFLNSLLLVVQKYIFKQQFLSKTIQCSVKCSVYKIHFVSCHYLYIYIYNIYYNQHTSRLSQTILFVKWTFT